MRLVFDALRTLFLAAALLAASIVAGPALAQEVELGGTAYVDYFYQLASPQGDRVGLDGFTYRRLYLTADYRLADQFSGRARLEASASTVGEKGPVPYVKDLYLRWKSEAGHQITGGVQPTPAFDVVEDIWGYRSLLETVMDRTDIVSSRDFGVRADGPILADGSIRYAVMFANNSDVKPEITDDKRYYAQLEAYPGERFVLVTNANYTDFVDARDGGFVVSGMAGYMAERFRVGIHPYWSRQDAAGGDELEQAGASLFASVKLSERWGFVGRVDRTRSALGAVETFETLALGALVYEPHPGVRLMPNFVLTREDQVDESDLLGRVTLEVRF